MNMTLMEGGLMQSKYDEFYAKFVGKGKIQPLRVKKSNKDTYVLIYKEGSKIQQIKCEDRNVLDALLVEFGGKNPETCKAQSRFLEINGGWTAEDIRQLGHTITKVKVVGDRVLRSKTVPIYLPEGTGCVGIIQSKKKNDKNEIVLSMHDRETAGFTRAFKDSEEFDTLIDFLLTNPSLKDLVWRLEVLCTESRDTGVQCLWKRTKAGDGTKRMVLELRALNGIPFTKCIRQDLYDAAGDMFDAPCKSIKAHKKDNLPTAKICLFAAEDGTIDIDKYELLE
jgi:hypothetical protein